MRIKQARKGEGLMKNLILITNSFPFGMAEASFIRPEIAELVKHFQVTVVSRNSKDEQTTELPDGVQIYRYDAKKNYAAVKLLVKTIFSPSIYRETAQLLKKREFSLFKCKRMLKYSMRALHFASYLRKLPVAQLANTVWYTYWNDYSVLSASMVKRKGQKLVSRAHRADLYLRADNNWYLPMKAISNQKTDLLACISEDGKTYFEENFTPSVPVRVFRLGVPRQNTRSPFQEKNTISILSFSYLSPVKRVEKIAETLATFEPNVTIQWTHIGDGTEREAVLQTAKELLSEKENVTYCFLGAMENADAMRYISETQFDFLLNVSASEGIPVTMMESMSFGIPVIGTNVGGVSEILCDGQNGFLMSAEASVQEIHNTICRYTQLTYREKCELRERTYAFWEKNYDSKINMQAFVSAIEM